MSAPQMTYSIGGIDVGTLIDDTHIYETEGINKVVGTAIAKNAGLLNTNASGELVVCPVAGLGPYYLPGEAALAADLRASVYGTKARGIKYVLKNSTNLVANDPVKPSTTVPGQVEKFIKGTDSLEKLVGWYRGLATQAADLTSKNVLQANATSTGLLCVIEKA
jgi:hypothetical protein